MTRVGRVAVVWALALAFSASAAAQIRPLAKRKQQARRQQMVEKFSQLPPEERDRMLKKLPEDRRKQVEDNLERYKGLSEKQKANLSKQFENFRDLPPEKQQRVRRLFREMNELPVERRGAIRREVARLRRGTEDERKERLGSDSFKDAYSGEEQRIIRELAGLLPPGE